MQNTALQFVCHESIVVRNPDLAYANNKGAFFASEHADRLFAVQLAKPIVAIPETSHL